jgi:hypothetical protein
VSEVLSLSPCPAGLSLKAIGNMMHRILPTTLVRLFRLHGVLAVVVVALAVAGRVLAGEPAGTPDTGQAEAAGSKPAEDTKADDLAKKWVRLLRGKGGEPLAMQTAIVRYVKDSDAQDGDAQDGANRLTVDLIGAIHVGDQAYYEGLNKRFEQYEALLYELVAPEGTVVEKGRGTSSSHPVGAIQNGLKAFLDLEHQLEHIDYTRKNFVHADMSPEEFSKSMADRGESFMKMYMRLIGQEIARQTKQQADGKFAEFGLLAAFLSSDRNRRLKIALAEQFEDLESMLAGFGGPDGSTIITERNRVALEVLAAQLSEGKRTVGVFYGAGHLADMDKRLREQFDLQPVEVTWLDAWNLRP